MIFSGSNHEHFGRCFGHTGGKNKMRRLQIASPKGVVSGLWPEMQ
jgi:hypothetical protein